MKQLRPNVPRSAEKKQPGAGTERRGCLPSAALPEPTAPTGVREGPLGRVRAHQPGQRPPGPRPTPATPGHSSEFPDIGSPGALAQQRSFSAPQDSEGLSVCRSAFLHSNAAFITRHKFLSGRLHLSSPLPPCRPHLPGASPATLLGRAGTEFPADGESRSHPCEGYSCKDFATALRKA